MEEAKPPATDFRSLYMTFPDAQSAQRVARSLVEERLVACVNLLPAGLSCYRWQGEVRQEAEVVAFAKTRAALVEKALERAASLHPYENPCLVTLRLEEGAPAYLAWLAAETT